MKRILFVDDEPRILTGLRRMLRSLRREWEMVFAESGAEALDHCASAPFDVIVSDARMPGMEGSELLAEVRRRHPDTVRLILSGQCSRDSVLNCVGVAHQFLSKPCDAETLKTAVGRVCRLRDQFGDVAARRAVSRIQALPSQPTVYTRLVEEVESPDASVESVAEVIGRDTAMCAKIVQLVSSGFFGTPQRVDDAPEAATLLGLETIKETVACGAFWTERSHGLDERALQALNDHSRAVAAAAKKIAETVTDDATAIGDAYLAGRLHAVGDLALPGGSRRGSGSNGRAGGPPPRATGPRASLPDPGGYLMALWGLPEPVVLAIGCHGWPASAADRGFGPLTAVHVADALLGPPAEPWSDRITSLDRDYLEQIGHADWLESWREACAARRPEGVML